MAAEDELRAVRGPDLPRLRLGACPGEKKPADCPHLAEADAARIAAYLGDRQPPITSRRPNCGGCGPGLPPSTFPRPWSGWERPGRRAAGRQVARPRLPDRPGRRHRFGLPHARRTGDPAAALRALQPGRPADGEWLPFRELEHAAGRDLHFEQMCEKPLKRLVDSHTELLKDLIDIFSGERSVNLFGSDVSLVLFPLPRIPVLICYWEPEEGMESSLHVFFDATATDHLSVAWIHSLCAGLVAMFEKIALKHV